MKKFLSLLFGMCILCLIMTVAQAWASDLGYVRQTDIVTFIDYSPIESYNYKDKTYIVAEDLMNYGFDVVWDNEKRELRVDRKQYNFTPYISDFVNEVKVTPTFEPLFKVYPTDIKTYVNGELTESYNIYGRTVINIDFMYHFGNCIYDDSKRLYEVRILEKEIENAKVKSEVVDESTDYYKYIKTVEEKGIFENGELVYGIKKNVTTNKYGDNTDIYIGDFRNNKTILYSKSYMYNDTMIHYNITSPAKISVDGDDVNPGYTVWFSSNSVAKAVIDNNFRYGIMINKIVNISENEGSEAMYLRYNGELYAIRYDEEEVDGFEGELFKDGKSIYKGKIYYDTLSFMIHNYGHLQYKNFNVLYAPSYTDVDGVIYYRDESVEGNGSIYYKGNVVNGVSHGSGVLYEFGARNYDTYLKDMYFIYGEEREIVEQTTKAGENVLYIGGFFNGLLNGKGKMYNIGSGLACSGEWVEGKLNGEAVLYTYLDENSVGLLYNGNMQNNKRHGFGIEYAPKGNPMYEGFYKRFVGEFNDGSWHNGKWYELEYNAEKNLHDIYLYYEGEVRYGEKQYGTHYRCYNEQTGQFETKTGYFIDWKFVQ